MSNPSYGTEAYAAVGQETSWGTAATRTFTFPVKSSSVVTQKETGYSEQTYGLDKVNAFTTKQKGAGDVAIDMRYDGFDWIFYNAMGNVASAAVTGGQSYRKQIVDQSLLPSGLTYEQHLHQRNDYFAGCRINEVSINYQQGSLLEVSYSLAGKAGVDNTGSAATYTAPSGLVITPDEGTVTISGVSSACVKSMTITKSNGLDTDRQCVTSKDINTPVRSERGEVRVEIELEHDSNTDSLVDSFYNEQELDITLEFTSSTQIGASSDYYSLKVELPKCRIESGFPALEGPGILPLSLSCVALRAESTDFDLDSSQAGAMKVTLVNGTPDANIPG